MASNFALAVDKMVRERDTAFLQKIAEDYKLPFEELQTKYLAVAEEAVKIKRPYKKREPKMVEVTNEAGEKVQVPVKADKEKKTCEALTSKKEPCKFSALKGGCFCKRHQRQHEEEQGGEPAPKRTKKEVVQKSEQPMHTHALDASGDQCNLCQSHGNPLTEDSDDFELVMPEEKKAMSAAERLAAMLEESDSDEESDDETVGPACDGSETEDPEATGFGSEYEDEE
jgi:antitoxin component of RelBE/YafQ-DinJ toxin-antitoxin module